MLPMIGGGGVSLISPSEECQALAVRLKYVMLLLAISLAGVFVVEAYDPPTGAIVFWPVVLTLLLGVGFWSVRDQTAFKPNWMLWFVRIISFGVVLVVVYLLECALSGYVVVSVVLVVSALLSVLETNLAWRTYKEMCNCVPLLDTSSLALPIHAQQLSRGGGGGGGPPTSSSSSLFTHTISNPLGGASGSAASPPGNTAFVLFQGTGERLGS